MKVKSFKVGLVNQLRSSMELLDELVKELGPIHIHSITDTYHKGTYVENGEGIVRVVVYTPVL